MILKPQERSLLAIVSDRGPSRPLAGRYIYPRTLHTQKNGNRKAKTPDYQLTTPPPPRPGYPSHPR